MSLPNKKCSIFESCNQLFPELVKGLKASEDGGYNLELVATSDGDCDLKLKNVDKVPLKGQIRVRLFSEFKLNGETRRHPNFLLGLDFVNRRAEVLSFESNLFPHIRLDAYSVVKGDKYKNIVASKDLETLCLTWIKQLNELNYSTLWEQKQKMA
jgi:hypothetical protein